MTEYERIKNFYLTLSPKEQEMLKQVIFDISVEKYFESIKLNMTEKKNNPS